MTAAYSMSLALPRRPRVWFAVRSRVVLHSAAAQPARQPMSDQIHPDDRSEMYDLIEDARHGDRQAFARIFTLLYDRVRNTAHARVGSRHDAEEIADDVMIAVWRKLPDYEYTGAPFASWVLGIAHLQILMHQRSASRRAQTTTIDAAPEIASTDATVDDHADRSALMAALATLDDTPRQVLALRFYGGLTAEEIAAMLELTPGNVRQIQFRALERLQRSAHTQELPR